jgi:hypothetical protein
MERDESPCISRLFATEVKAMNYPSDESRPQEVFWWLATATSFFSQAEDALLSTLSKLLLDFFSFTETIGATGFEPATSWSRTKRSSQAELRPGAVAALDG